MENISNPWRRLLALIIDFIILGIFGWLLGLFLGDFFLMIGEFGPIIGFLVALVYFTICHSKITKGQSIGKYFLSIRVVDTSFNQLSMKSASFRYLVLFFPYFFVNIRIPGLIGIPSLNIAWSTILILGIISIIIFLFVNRKTRQSLHDLVVHSIVIKDKKSSEINAVPQLSKRPYLITFSITGSLLLAFLIISLIKPFELGKVTSLFDRLNSIEGIHKVGVEKNTTTVYGKKESVSRSLKIELWIGDLPQDESEFTKSPPILNAIKEIVTDTSSTNNIDFIQIGFVTGFNIGIYSSKTTAIFKGSLDYWKEYLEEGA